MSEQGEVVNAGAAVPQPGDRRAPRAVMYAYPWDVYAHGVDRVLDDLEECGVDAVQLSFTYHVATFLTPRLPGSRVRFGEHGALQFDPDVLDSEWPVEPPVAAEVTGPDHLAALLAAFAGRGLDAVAWVVYLYNHALARRRPDLAVVNAYGDTHGAQLCPTNPTVRAYVLTLTSAVLSHAPLGGLVTESLSFLPYDYGFLNLKAAVTPGPAVGRLLSLCFCEHCIARALRAGVGVDALRSRVIEDVDAALAALPDGAAHPPSLDVPGDRSVALHDYLNVRADTASSLQRAVLALARTRGVRTGSNAAEGQDESVTGISNDSISDLRSEYRFEVLPGWSPADSAAAVTAAVRAAGPGVPVYVLAQLSNFASERSFASALEAVRGLGIERFRLYEYGLLSDRHLAWLRNCKHLWSGTERGTSDAGRAPVSERGADDYGRGKDVG